MKKLFLSFALIASVLGFSQEFSGLTTENYGGINRAIYNPATMADSRFVVDVNTSSLNREYGSDFYRLNFFNALMDKFKHGTNILDYSDRLTYPDNNNQFWDNYELVGPSFFFNLNDKSSVGLITRYRILNNFNNIDGDVYEAYRTGNFDPTQSFVEEKASYTHHAFVEVGVPYSRVIIDKKKRFLKAGITIKYLRGEENEYFHVENLDYKYDATDNKVDLTADVSYGKYNTSGKSGIGFDLGVEYEYRPNARKYKNGEFHKHENKYKYRVGLSITDIGSIAYPSEAQRAAHLDSINIPLYNFGTNGIQMNTVDQIFNPDVDLSTKMRVGLPTAFRADFDYHIKKRFYANFRTVLSLRRASAENKNRTVSYMMLTPRYEAPKFATYIPISFNQYGTTQVGWGIRWKNFIAGSSTIMTSILSKSKRVDFYVAAKISILQKPPNDLDKDGVLDKDDACIDVKGPVENGGCPLEDFDHDGVLDVDDECIDVRGPKSNNGCPIGDLDRDGTLDKDDKCIDVKGPRNNNGCPIDNGDLDGDGVPNAKDACISVKGPKSNNGCPLADKDNDGVQDKDDACIDVPGPKENHGCPIADKDGDGVKDSEDQCIDIKGSKENHGCPKVTKSIENTLNKYANALNFDTGKYTFRPESYKVLVDILMVMNKYPQSSFVIHGHTDNVGNAANNLKLSHNRANAVMKFLISNGIDKSRLTSRGFGETRPIAPNTTKEGRLKNRRVEIKFVK
jgi:outer membrane protein OmpA-like peptidoglycan-associated protein